MTLESPLRRPDTERVAPDVTPEQQAALSILWDIWERKREVIDEALMHFVAHHRELGHIAESARREDARAAELENQELQYRAIKLGEWTPLVESLRVQGARYAHQGLSFRSWIELIGAVRRIVGSLLLEEAPGDSSWILLAGSGMAVFLDTVLSAIGEGYLRAKEEIIQKQRAEIRTLSTPVLQLESRLLVLPLIGTFDADRAQQLTRQLLDAVRERHARAVVIDVTGVAEAEETLAQHLVRIADSARLMGTTVIVTGLSNAAAHSLVKLGVDLTKLNTSGDLQSGVVRARSLLSTDPRVRAS